MTEILFHISSEKTGAVFAPLARACQRNKTSWACFFTGEGVKQLNDIDLVQLLSGAERAVACEHAWHENMGEKKCPLELGSQTNNSEMMTETTRVISL
ncbi:MAG: hypothetical protein H8E38_04520 [SAR324 cluster bacterium]|nr:hypothetical protein [SAR324 cluster bacterium]MBL7035614.1 hypothetical protein [SAR324 cluster bacterium]